MDLPLVRALSTVAEVLHGEIYSAPEAKQIYGDAGLKGGWMGYMASRAAPLGAVSAEVVAAVFYNFHDRLVRRSIPDAWTFASPERVLQARNELGRIAIERCVEGADPAEVAEAADLFEQAALAAAIEGRALFAANAALPWPEGAPMRLWHATTLLREHRGDGHNAVLLAEGIDRCECHLLAIAAEGTRDEDGHREHRGFTVEEWEAARQRLRARGLLDDAGAFTAEGRALKQHIEDRTDALAAQPYQAIGPEACARVLTLAPRIAPRRARLMPR